MNQQFAVAQTINGWQTNGENAIWMEQTQRDPQGKTHTLMAVVSRTSSPALQAARNADGRELPVPEPQEGMHIRLLLDGAPQATLELGGAFDLPLDEFVRQNPAAEFVQQATEILVGNLPGK